MIFVLHIGHCNVPSLYFSVSYNWKVQAMVNMDVRCVNESSTVFKTEQPSGKKATKHIKNVHISIPGIWKSSRHSECQRAKKV
jgi:hypothetical protein